MKGVIGVKTHDPEHACGDEHIGDETGRNPKLKLWVEVVELLRSEEYRELDEVMRICSCRSQVGHAQ